MTDLIIAPYSVTVTGWPEMTYYARSRGQALSKAWGDYSSNYDASFKDFLGMARARKAEPAGRFGERIIVSGEPAIYVGQRGQYVQFVLPGTDTILNAHPLDVKPAGEGKT